MNANLTLSEIITIALVILIVFGPQRLPEMARKAGEIIAKLRTAASSIKDEFTAEYEELAKPLSDLDAEIKAVKTDLTDSVPKLDSLTEGIEDGLNKDKEDGLNKDEEEALNGDKTAAAPSGNGEVDSFEAELAAAKEEAAAELAREASPPSTDEQSETVDDPSAAPIEVDADESGKA